MKRWLIFLVFVCLVFSGYTQVPYNTAYLQGIQPAYSSTSYHFPGDTTAWSNPKKATVLAMVIPGAGQIFNKKYLKAGIVYGGIAGLIYSYQLNRDSLSIYQAILVNKLRAANDTLITDNYPLLSTAGVKSTRDFYRRNRDVTIIGFVALYALQIIDANVDAHLKEFEINEDLALRISPDIMRRRAGVGTYNGLTLSLRLK